ncbi:MAG: hypothetical protein HYS18_07895 [Burkholderiales bacterium]|nr:hypothetical protein [Burkholderiales bacterium]
MIKKMTGLVALWFGLSLCSFAYANTKADETLVNAFLEIRQSLVQDEKFNVHELSKSIREAVEAAAALEKKGHYRDALSTLSKLEKYKPLTEIPSFDVHALASRYYAKLGDQKTADFHQIRADAMRELFMNRIGDGQSLDTPIRIIMSSELSDWLKVQGGNLIELRSKIHKGKSLHALTYSIPAGGDQPRTAYFEMDPRVRARLLRQIDR